MREGREGEEEEDVLGRLERTWPRGKGKKKARFLLTRLSPYQSYMLAKLRFIAHMHSSSSSSPSSSSSSSFSSSFQALTHTARGKIIDARLEAHTELLDLQKEEEEEAQADIWCREEVKGQVFSFVENGRLYLARSRSTSPDYPPPLSAAVAASSPPPPSLFLPPPAAAAAAAVPGNDDDDGEKKEGSDNSTLTAEKEKANNVSPPHPAGLCPLSVLKAARADIFLVGEYKEEKEGEGNPPAENGSGNSSSSSSSSSSGRVEDEEWVLLPALPRAEIYCRKEEEEEEEEGGRDVPAAVLRALVYEVRDESVLDALQAMLWTGGRKKG